MEYKFIICLQVFGICILWSVCDCGEGGKLSTDNCHNENKNLQGGNIINNFTNIQSWIECKKLCEKSYHCNYWVYHHKNAVNYSNLCKLQTDFFDVKEDSNTIYGPKTCAVSRVTGKLQKTGIVTYKCPSNKTNENGLELEWKSSTIGANVSSLNICPADGLPLAYRMCESEADGTLRWGNVQYRNCSSKDEISKVTKKLKDLSLARSHAQNLAQSLKKLTSDPFKLVADDIFHSSKVLEIISKASNLGKKAVEDCVHSVNNLLKAPITTLRRSNKKGRSSSRIMDSLDRIGREYDLGNKSSTRFEDKKITLFLVDDTNEEIWVNLSSKASISLSQGLIEHQKELYWRSCKETESGKEYIGETSLTESGKECQRWDLPTHKFTKAVYDYFKYKSLTDAQNYCRNPDGDTRPWCYTVNSSTTFEYCDIPFCEKKRRLAFMFIQNVGLFETYDEAYIEASTLSTSPNAINGIVSASVIGAEIKDMDNAVTITFAPINDKTKNPVCAFWFSNEGHEYWSSKGCETEIGRDKKIICTCNHLSSFAVLTTLNAADYTWLNILTYIGISLSILGLFLIVLHYIVLRKFRRNNPSFLGPQSMLHYSISLICVYILFLVGEAAKYNSMVCICIGALLYYFLLVSFGWMLFEGIKQHLKFTSPGSIAPDFMFAAALSSWTVPVSSVWVLAVFDYEMFHRPNDLCWLSKNVQIKFFVIPATLVILVNAVLYGRCLYYIYDCKDKAAKSNESRSEFLIPRLKLSSGLFFSLGFVWIFGILANFEKSGALETIFVILASSQGFFVFLLFASNKSFRKLWMKEIRKCKREKVKIQICKRKPDVNEVETPIEDNHGQDFEIKDLESTEIVNEPSVDGNQKSKYWQPGDGENITKMTSKSVFNYLEAQSTQR